MKRKFWAVFDEDGPLPDTLRRTRTESIAAMAELVHEPWGYVRDCCGMACRKVRVVDGWGEDGGQITLIHGIPVKKYPDTYRGPRVR